MGAMIEMVSNDLHDFIFKRYHFNNMLLREMITMFCHVTLFLSGNVLGLSGRETVEHKVLQ